MNKPSGLLLAELNLAQTALQSDRVEDAVRHFENAEGLISAAGERRYGPLYELVDMAIAVRAEQWTDVDNHLERFERRHHDDETRQLIWDYPTLLEKAARDTEYRGRPETARRIRRLAREMWKQLGDPEAVQRLEAQLEEKT